MRCLMNIDRKKQIMIFFSEAPVILYSSVIFQHTDVICEIAANLIRYYLWYLAPINK